MSSFAGFNAPKRSDQYQGDVLFEQEVERLIRTGKISRRGLRKVFSKYMPNSTRAVTSARIAALKAPFIVDTIWNREFNDQFVVISGADAMRSPSEIAIELMNARLTAHKDAIREVLVQWSVDSREVSYVIALKDLSDSESSEVKADICFGADDVEYETDSQVDIRVQFVPFYLINRFRPSHTDASAALSGSGQGE